MVSGETTVLLPTAVPPAEATPVNTRVIPVESLTPAPTATETPIPDESRAVVTGIVDGQTILVVMEGDKTDQMVVVRYLGIETPPPDDPWGAVARETNRALTGFKAVRLVRDTSNFDEAGNLLRYVYVDEQLLSLLLVEQGLARAAVQSPDTQFEDRILEAEARARAAERGIWSGAPPTATPTRVISDESSPESEAANPLATATVNTGSATPVLTLTLTPTLTTTAIPEEEATISPTVTVSPTTTSE